MFRGSLESREDMAEASPRFFVESHQPSQGIVGEYVLSAIADGSVLKPLIDDGYKSRLSLRLIEMRKLNELSVRDQLLEGRRGS